MSTLDREPRISGGRNDALHEPRVDPGSTELRRTNRPSSPPKVLPRGPNLTGAEKRVPVKR